MAQLLRSGTLEDELGDQLHDFLIDELANKCEEVWSTVRVDQFDDDEEFEWPIAVLCFERVYFVRSPEHDDAGYFLSLDAAREYVRKNWTDVQG